MSRGGHAPRMAPPAPSEKTNMTTIRSFMTDDHRRCDDLFAEAEQALGKGNLEAARAAFGHFRTATLAHFESEEKTLFPSFEAKTGMSMGPTQVMRMEIGRASCRERV